MKTLTTFMEGLLSNNISKTIEDSTIATPIELTGFTAVDKELKQCNDNIQAFQLALLIKSQFEDIMNIIQKSDEKAISSLFGNNINSLENSYKRVKEEYDDFYNKNMQNFYIVMRETSKIIRTIAKDRDLAALNKQSDFKYITLPSVGISADQMEIKILLKNDEEVTKSIDILKKKIQDLITKEDYKFEVNIETDILKNDKIIIWIIIEKK